MNHHRIRSLTLAQTPARARHAACLLTAFVSLATANCVAADASSQGVVNSTAHANARLSAIEPGVAINLGALDLTDPEGEGKGSANRVTDYSGMVYDPHNHRILMFGGGHATTYTDSIYAFDFKTLTWSALYAPTPKRFYKPENMEKGFWKAGGSGPYPRPAARHTYDLLVVPDHRKELLLLRAGGGPSEVAPGIGYFGSSGGAYDFATGKWEAFRLSFGGYGSVSEYDPVSKKIIGGGGQELFLFDPDTRQTSKMMWDISDKQKVGVYSGTMVYFPPDQCMYCIPMDKKIWKLKLDREDFKKSAIIKFDARGDVPPPSECAFAYDADAKLLGGGILKNRFYTFDPASQSWTAIALKGEQPGDMTFHCLVYDPVDRVYIFLANQKTYAYRLPVGK